MSFQGDYDPNTYNPANPATWPQPSGIWYQPGQWWRVSVAGSFDGEPVIVDDRIYVVGHGRRYGESDYGEWVFGGPPDNNWSVDQVNFLVWHWDLSPWLRPPKPYSGCPFGSRAPGWRVVIEALYNADVGSHVYGSNTYGDGVYGDAAGRGFDDWNDVTAPAWSVTVRRGDSLANYAVPVDEVEIEFTDPDFTVWPLAAPASWFTPSVGTMIRVGLLPPTQDVYYPLAVGRIEQIADDHVTLPRFVSIQAFGLVMDLATTIQRWRRNPEPAVSRLEDLIDTAGWQWGPVESYPAGLGPTLLGDAEPLWSVVGRELIDRVAISAGWYMLAARNGLLRFVEWPPVGSGTPLVVVDCEPGSGELLASSIAYLSDMAQLVNEAQLTNVLDETVTATAFASVGQVGHRTSALGMPLTENYAQAVNAQAIVDRIATRLGPTATRVASFEADTWRDPAWFDDLLTIDLGLAVNVIRRASASAPLDLDGVVVGIEHRLSRNRWTASIFTHTTTPTI